MKTFNTFALITSFIPPVTLLALPHLSPPLSSIPLNGLAFASSAGLLLLSHRQLPLRAAATTAALQTLPSLAWAQLVRYHTSALHEPYIDKAVLEAVLIVAGGTLAALWAALWTQAVAWPDVPRPNDWWDPDFDGPENDWHRNRRVEGEEADVCGGGGEEGDGWNAMSVGLGEKTRETEELLLHWRHVVKTGPIAARRFVFSFLAIFVSVVFTALSMVEHEEDAMKSIMYLALRPFQGNRLVVLVLFCVFYAWLVAMLAVILVIVKPGPDSSRLWIGERNVVLSFCGIGRPLVSRWKAERVDDVEAQVVVFGPEQCHRWEILVPGGDETVEAMTRRFKQAADKGSSSR